jgi:leucyl aminopeptidase
MQIGVKVGEAIAASTVMARDLVSSPPADKTPTIIATEAKEIARRFGLKLRVLEKDRMRKLGMGGLLGVAAGSAQPPKFLIVEYRKGGKKPFSHLSVNVTSIPAASRSSPPRTWTG